MDWLESIPNPLQTDYGYGEFYRSVETTLQGANTYRQILSWGVDFPYPDKENFVFTRQSRFGPDHHVQFINTDPVVFTQKLKEKDGGIIWLIGGAQINTLLLSAGLIDELHLHIMPVILPDGIDLFNGPAQSKPFRLGQLKNYDNGVVEISYHRIGGNLYEGQP